MRTSYTQQLKQQHQFFCFSFYIVTLNHLCDFDPPSVSLMSWWHPPEGMAVIGGSLRDLGVACSASDGQGSNFESCVLGTVSSQSSHHPQEILLAQFSLYVHKGGLKPDFGHFIWPSLVHWFIFTITCDHYTSRPTYIPCSHETCNQW